MSLTKARKQHCSKILRFHTCTSLFFSCLREVVTLPADAENTGMMKLSVKSRPAWTLWKQKLEQISLKSNLKPVFTAAFELGWHRPLRGCQAETLQRGGRRPNIQLFRCFCILLTLSRYKWNFSVAIGANPKCIWAVDIYATLSYGMCSSDLLRWIKISAFWHLNKHVTVGLCCSFQILLM